MRIGSIGGRAWFVTADGKGADIAEASGGRFSSDPQALYDVWGDFRDWCAGLRTDHLVAVDPATFELPVPRPRQIFAIGANYRAHAAEAGVEPPEQPVIFTKFPSCLTGPNDAIPIRHERVDWEVELVVVMGREARNVPAAQAWDHVAGLAAGQDISERSIQRLGPMPQFSMAKSLPGFGPVGPLVVTPDEFADPDDLELGCAVNGVPMQTSRTSDFIFPVADLVEYISHLVPMFPGDLIFTGTPEGVGATRKPPIFLKPGDVLTTWVEGIGTLTNLITEEQAQ